MSEREGLSDVKRALLEKYRNGALAQTVAPPPAAERPTSLEPAPEVDLKVPVVPIQTGGSGRPFFYLHIHVIGGAFYNFALAQHIGSDQPFYMLDPYMFDSKHMPPTLEAMAAEYVKSLRIAQPEGPYLLGGFCGGAFIALEMAQQLRDQGQEVDLLVLIEARIGLDFHLVLLRKLFGGFIRRFGFLIGLNLEKQLGLFLWLRHVGLCLLQPSYRKEKKFKIFPGKESLRTDWIAVFVWILSLYQPRAYPGKVTYLWACEEPRYRGKLVEAKELEVQFISGTHDTCRTDHLSDMARHLRDCLKRVQAVDQPGE